MYSHAQTVKSVRNVGCRWTASTAEIPDQSPKLMVVDSAGKLIEATPAARAFLAVGLPLRCTFGRLETASRGNGIRLDAALGEALRKGHASVSFDQPDAAGGTLEADMIAIGDDPDTVRIVIILKPAHEERRRRLDEAQTGYGLTAAETRLLATLFEGCSVPQAAHRLGVARSTARTHLQRIFDKTGARRQGDLLRMVACA